MVIVCFAVNYASTLVVTSTEEGAYFIEYTYARSAVWDYAIPDYADCQAQYDAIGISENDIAMLRGDYMDGGGEVVSTLVDTVGNCEIYQFARD